MKKTFIFLAMCMATTPLRAHNVTPYPNPMVLEVGDFPQVGRIWVTPSADENCTVRVVLGPTFTALPVLHTSNGGLSWVIVVYLRMGASDIHVGDSLSDTITGTWTATGLTTGGQSDPQHCGGGGVISVPITFVRPQPLPPKRGWAWQGNVEELDSLGGSPSGSAVPASPPPSTPPKSAPLAPLDFGQPVAAAAAGGGSWILVPESNDQLELINLNSPCASGASCPPNPTIAVGQGSGPLRACTNDVNGDGVQDLCAFTSSGQFCEFITQPDGSHKKVCTLVGSAGAKDAIPFPCSARGVTTCVASIQPSPDPNDSSWQVLTFLAAADGTLTQKGTFPATVGPASLATADLNGDGNADLVVVNTGRNTVSVFLGDGSGGFGASNNFAVGTAPVAVAVGDVNGDGKADLLVSNSGSNNVSVLLGDGKGGFATPKNIALGGAPLGIAIGDLNLDGKPDLAVAYPSLNAVDVYLGDGAGGFTQAFTFRLEATPLSVVIADFNGDTKPDLAVINSGLPAVPNTQYILVHYNSMVYPTCKLAGEPAVNSVVNGASFQAGIAANAMISIYGSGFQPAGQTHLAGGADFVNGGFPTVLSCLAVELDGLRAPLAYTSGGQINAQAPAGLTAGAESVRVILNPDSANAIFSNAFTAQAQALSPAFFTFDGKSIAAVDGVTGAGVADPAAVPGTLPAQPGEILSLYGTGFGATNPPYLEGQLASGAATITTPFSVSFGGVTLSSSDVLYGGLSPGSISGLYQFNVRVPSSLSDGNQPVTITIGGQPTQSGASIAVTH